MTAERLLSRQKMSEQLQKDLDDVWYDYKECVVDHIEEVEDKWDHIDDEVWSKVIIMEKNKRVAKILLRKPNVGINNGEVGYSTSGVIGLRGFENSIRSKETESVLKRVGKGCRISMDNGGNIIVNKFMNKNLYTRKSYEELEPLDQTLPMVVFDMRKFQIRMKKEIRKGSPNWKQLREEAVTTLVFVEARPEPLEQPLWVLVINVVALDLLRNRMKTLAEAEAASFSRFAGDTEAGARSGGSKVTRIRSKSEGAAAEDGSGARKKKKFFGHPFSWHFKAPVPPVRIGSKVESGLN